MKRYSFALHLLALVALVASMNACIIADRQIVAREALERRDQLQLDEAVHFVIPQYYRTYPCGKYNRSTCRNLIGTRIYEGAFAALTEIPLRYGVGFTDSIHPRGLVCVVRVEKQSIDDDISYSEMFSALTFFVVPSYAKHKRVLSYSLILDSKNIGKYQYEITENVIISYVSWMLFPLLYPFWEDTEIGIAFPFDSGGKEMYEQNHVPRSKTIKEATKMFLLEARRDGIL